MAWRQVWPYSSKLGIPGCPADELRCTNCGMIMRITTIADMHAADRHPCEQLQIRDWGRIIGQPDYFFPEEK